MIFHWLIDFTHVSTTVYLLASGSAVLTLLNSTNQFGIWTLLCGIAVLSDYNRCSIFLTRYLACYTLPVVVEMAHFQSSNVIIHGGTFNSAQAQGDLHINNKDSGMHDFWSVQKSILIDDSMKDFMTWK